MEYIRKILASNLLRLRKKSGHTQGLVASGASVTIASYSRWENGINWPDPESIEKLATFYKIPSSEFFVDESLLRPETPPLDPESELLKELQEVIRKHRT